MDNRIEAYFGKMLTAGERAQFEREMRENAELAGEVAFYLAARKAQADGARQEMLEARHAEWQRLPENGEGAEGKGSRPLKSWWAAAAAVAALAIALAWYLNVSGPSYERLAHEYVSKELQTVNTQMDGTADSLQLAARLFNDGSLEGARRVTDGLLAKEPDHAETKKLAGIVSLRMKDYDKAIEHFQQLGAREDLFSNPGKFYEALARLERNGPGDKEKAEGLLKEVVEKGLEGKEVVEEWGVK